MADKDFVVKNGLVVNANTTSGGPAGFLANSTQFTLNTINATANGILANSTAIVFGNSSVSVSINTSSISINGGLIANSTGANNAFRLGGVLASSYVTGTPWTSQGYLTAISGSGNVAYDSSRLNNQSASYYTNASNISTGTLPWPQMPSTTVNTTGNFTIAGNLNFTGTNTYFSGKTTFNANIVINPGVAVFDSTGSQGTAGQILTSNGTGNVYWSTVTTSSGGLTSISGAGNVAYDSTRLGGALASTYAPLASPTFTGTVTTANVLTIGTSSYFVSNGNIGLGTSSPDYKLTVNGSIRSVGLKTYELVTPTGVLTTTGSGSLAAAVYYIRVVAVDALGGLTEPSSEVSRTSGASGSILVQFDAVPGAVKYRIYFKAGSTPTDTYFESTTNSYNLTTISGASSRTIPAFNSTGAVNIGSFANTDYKLTVQNNANGAGQLLLYNSNTGTGTAIGIDLIHAASASTSQIYHYPDGKLALKGASGISFQTGSYTGTERMKLDVDSGTLTVYSNVVVGSLGNIYAGPAVTGYGYNTNGVFGKAAAGGTGVHGESLSGTGVYGFSTSGIAVGGYSNSNMGLNGYSNNLHGVWGQTANTSMFGVVGISYGNSSVTAGVGVGAYSNTNLALYAKSNTFTIARFANATATNLSISNLGQIGINIGDYAPAASLHISKTDSPDSMVFLAGGATGIRMGANAGLGAWIEGVDGIDGVSNYRNLLIGGNNISINTGTGSSSVQRISVSNTGIVYMSGDLRVAGDITAHYSDRRLKENVVVISNAIEKVNSLNGITYTSNDLAETFGFDKKTKLVGLFADEVEAVLPEAIKRAPFDTDNDGNSKSGENYKTVQYEKIVPLLVEAIKELKAEIEQLKGSK